MKNIVDINNIISSTDINEIASYCNDKEFNKEFMEKEINQLSLLVGNSISTKTKCGHFNIELKYRKNDEVAVVIRYKISGIEDKACMVIARSGYERFISDFEKVINIVVLGTQAVSELNEKIISIQNENNSSTMFYYNVGINNKSCEIADWDYDKVMIRLSRSASTKLIEIYQSGEIDSLLENVNWEMGICEFVREFNKLSISIKLDATLKSQAIEDLLIEHMISVDDIVALLNRGINTNGVSVIKTVCILKELGRFAVISDWKIDNKSKDVSVEITYNKILDLDTGRFVVDNGFVGRVQKRILNNSNKIGEYNVKCVESR